MNKTLLTLAILLVSTLSFSQEIKSYEWDANPVFENIPEKYKTQPAVVLFDKRWVHTRVGQYAYATFVMNHFAVKINKAEEINNYNKVTAENNGYIRKLRDFHARIIKPNGTIQVIPEDRIVEKEVNKVKSIVFEGVEAGDILEYYFILKEMPSTYGVEVYQKEIPVLLAEFHNTASGVSFFVEASTNFNYTYKSGKQSYIAKDIEPFIEETNAKNVKSLVKLIYNVSSGGSSDWKGILSAQYKKPSFNYFSKSKARDFIENLKLEGLSTDQKVQKIDAYIKQNFDFVERGERAAKVKNLNDGKQKLQASDIFDLYGFTFKELDIAYYVVIAIDRFYADINPNKLITGLPYETMYYIPETEKFVSPYEKYLAYGDPMYEMQSTNGVAYFPAKNKMITPFTFPVAAANKTIMTTQNSVTLDADLSNIKIQKEYGSTGFRGGIERQNIKYLNEDNDEKEKTEFFKSVLMNGEDVKITNLKIENEGFEHNYTNIPLKISATVQFVNPAVEEAGNLLIVNLGKAIGLQTNLYQETKRTKDVDLTMTKTYKHTIKFTIPEGYKVDNFSELVLDVASKKNKDACSFKSKGKIEGNQLIVEVDEVYNTIHFDKEDYDDYRNVINASADFYKGGIVLKKQ